MWAAPASLTSYPLFDKIWKFWIRKLLTVILPFVGTLHFSKYSHFPDFVIILLLYLPRAQLRLSERAFSIVKSKKASKWSPDKTGESLNNSSAALSRKPVRKTHNIAHKMERFLGALFSMQAVQRSDISSGFRPPFRQNKWRGRHREYKAVRFSFPRLLLFESRDPNDDDDAVLPETSQEWENAR